MTFVFMPDMSTLDFVMETGTIVKWLKKEGESVEKGESLLEVETPKVVIEVKSPASGKISKILAPEGAEVPVAEKIAIIE
ncbi:MAG: biotin attachment protein [Candidatus Bathyarchaeota archaeon]|nr:biotin attachment protein [Candidatus Bathyarchaeota archaeon]